jgi:CRISPR/Cas system CSM-associated protein Csm2 small subunit
MGLMQAIEDLALVDIFKEAKQNDLFIGRPYYLDFDKAYLLITDAWKEKVGGIPQGTFILAFYENENDDVDECLLMRAIKPAKLPTDSDVIASMVEYYKDNLKTSGKKSQLDDFTKYTFSFSGLECRILGTFFRDSNGDIQFGADVENYYSAHNYVAYKPIGDILEQIVNFRDGSTMIGNKTDYRIGKVRYSSSLRFQEKDKDVPVYVSPNDFLGKRTALFGMTRTGKSNTVKKIIEATTEISKKTTQTCRNSSTSITENVKQFNDDGIPKYRVGQIIFDMNGEYANANLQDEGTAIFEKYSNITTRYSVLDKPGFKVLKVNFFKEIDVGFGLIRSLLEEESGDYIKSFVSIDLEEPKDQHSSSHIRWERKVAAYQCCLMAAGFTVPDKHRVKFQGNNDINGLIMDAKNIDPARGITLEEATAFWTWVAENQNHDFFKNYRARKGHDWVDEDLKALLVVLTRKRSLTGSANITGYRKLVPLKDYHTIQSDTSFETDIVDCLRRGDIVIIDLSQGDPAIQKTFAEKICISVFRNAMDNFVKNQPNNFIQFYFEEAHNLFPQKEDKDLSGIYNRIAKEGAKLNIGLIYATQEVSSISSNILKNTQNWFIAHLNNDDELKEIKKFYDFEDFCESLVRYSSGSDKGFIRMKTYSNAFIVPVQVDRFTA